MFPNRIEPSSHPKSKHPVTVQCSNPSSSQRDRIFGACLEITNRPNQTLSKLHISTVLHPRAWVTPSVVVTVPRNSRALFFFDAIDDEPFQPFIDVVPKAFWTSLHNYVAKTVPQKNATIDKSEMVPKSAKRKECWRLWWEKQKIKKKWNCEGEKK